MTNKPLLLDQESSQRFVKQRDEQEVEYVSDGKVIAKEMRYATENQFMERDGSKEDETDWDSLSDRVKKSRRQLQKTLLQKQRGESWRENIITVFMTIVIKGDKDFHGQLRYIKTFLVETWSW